MKTLLITIIYFQISLLGFMAGYTYRIYEQLNKSDNCITEILNSETKLKDYFGHEIQMKNIWVHAESYVSNRHFFCMNRREK